MYSNFGDKAFKAAVVDQKSLDGFSGEGAVTSGCTVFVYDAGTKTLATIYADGNRAALANPITRAQFTTDGKISFFGGSATYDIAVNDDQGNWAHVAGFSPLQHTVAMDRSRHDKLLAFPLVFNAGGTEVDTGLDLPKHSMVYDVALEVVTIDATETVAIGLLSTETAGDADGFLVATSVAVAGFFGSYLITDGSSEDYVSASRKGALLGLGSTGTDAGNDFGQPGGPGHFVTGANAVSISYTPSSSDTFAGYGYVMFRRLR